jgi:ureidoacrylate peracid hydrolase
MPRRRPEVERADTALLVIDMQNGFCHPDAAMAALEIDASACTAAAGGCATLIEAAHSAGVPVIYTQYVYQPDYSDGGRYIAEKQPVLKKIGAIAAGSWDAEILEELAPEPGDHVITKNRFSAFYSPELEPLLERLGTQSLVVCGVTTNMCVESTVRDAAQRDYRVFVAADATGELDEERHRVALQAIEFNFGWVVDVADVLEGWAGAS